MAFGPAAVLEALITASGLTVNPSAEAGEATSYEAWIAGQRLRIRLREISLSEAERIHDARLVHDGVGLLNSVTGKRLQAVIASVQADHRHRTGPSLLVLSDPAGKPFADGAYFVRLAFMGRAPVAGSAAESDAIPVVREHRMQPSAVGLIEAAGQVVLHVHHNPYARAPIAPSVLRGSSIRHYALTDGDRFATPGWQEV